MAEQTKNYFRLKEPVRFSFVKLFEIDDFAQAYTAHLLIPKDSPIVKQIEKEVKKATETEYAKQQWKNKKPKKDRLVVLKDGDEKFDEDPDLYEVYEDHYYIQAKSKKRQPQIRAGRDKQPVTSPDGFYSGSWGYALIELIPYQHDSGNGLTTILHGVLRTDIGEPLGGGGSVDVDDAFADIELDDDEDEDLL